MGQVGDALASYAQTVAAAGFDYFGRMRPGRSRSEVERRLTDAGVPLHDDAIDWYSFHDGLQPSHGDPYVELYDFVGICTLDEALAHREVRLAGYLAHLGFDDDEIREIREAGLEMPYEPGWLPIAVGQQTCVIAAETHTADARLLALWDDEQEPRVKAPDLASWIAELTVVAGEDGLSTHETADAVGIQRALFEFGSLTLINRILYVLDNLPSRLEEYQSPKVVLLHRPVGSLPGNKALERRQAEAAADYLRDALGIELPIEFRAGMARVGNRVSVDILAGLPPAGTHA